MGALMACRSCGFVTRRGSEIGVRGCCPHCEREMKPVTLTAARSIMVRKQELARAARALLPPLTEAPRRERRAAP
jgi:hypothetical protein